MSEKDIEIGDHVQNGTGRDWDCGTVLKVEGDYATVAWISGVRTRRTHLGLLAPMSLAEYTEARQRVAS